MVRAGVRGALLTGRCLLLPTTVDPSSFAQLLSLTLLLGDRRAILTVVRQQDAEPLCRQVEALHGRCLPIPQWLEGTAQQSRSRLASASARVPLEGEEEQALAAAAASAELVLLTEAFARRLPAGLLERYQAGPHPLVGVIPDVTGRVWPPDLAAEIRRHLGIAAGGS